MTINKNGTLTDISNQEYHSESLHLSSSNLKLLLKDPASFYDTKILGNKEERKDSDAFLMGSYLHSAILEPHTLEEEYVLYHGFQKRGTEWQEFKEANEGKQIVSKAQKMRIDSWIAQYKKNRTAVKLVSGSQYEVSLFTKLHGVPIKVRADIINEEKSYIADLKTTSGPTDLESFKQTVQKWGYDLSAALYLQCFEQYYGKPMDFYFIVIGKKDLDCTVYKLSQASRDKGEEEILRAIHTYNKCLESGIWTTEQKHVKIGISDEIEEV